MTNIEAAEFFEEEINPNMYAGAAMIARMMIEKQGAAEITATSHNVSSELDYPSQIGGAST